jgi:hypothetical protein
MTGGGELSLVEGRNCRWTGAITGGRELLQLEGSNCRWSRVIAGGGELLQVEGGNCRWRGAIADGKEQSHESIVFPTCFSTFSVEVFSTIFKYFPDPSIKESIWDSNIFQTPSNFHIQTPC